MLDKKIRLFPFEFGDIVARRPRILKRNILTFFLHFVIF